DVRIVALDVAEAILHELADAGRAVHARDDGDVIPRPDTTVLALVTVEGAHGRGRIGLDGRDVDTDLVAIGRELADIEVVRVDVVAERNVARRESDHLAVAPDRLAGAAAAPRDLVARADVLPHLDARGPVPEPAPRRQPRPGDRDVVLGLQHDRLLRQRVRRHDNLRVHYTPPGALIRRTGRSGSSWMVV